MLAEARSTSRKSWLACGEPSTRDRAEIPRNGPLRIRGPKAREEQT